MVCPFSVEFKSLLYHAISCQIHMGLFLDTLSESIDLFVWISLVAQTVKHLPTMQETQVWSLGWEDPLEKETATHSSTLAWKIPWTEDPGRLPSMGSQRAGQDWATSLSLSTTGTRTGVPVCRPTSCFWLFYRLCNQEQGTLWASVSSSTKVANLPHDIW